jgi:hypothetical protein
MIAMAAWWGLGFAALLVAAAIYGWHVVDGCIVHATRQAPTASKAMTWTAQTLSAIGTILLWAGLWTRALKGHGWPIVSPADTAMGIALLLLLLHTCWSLFSRRPETSLLVTIIALALLTCASSQFPQGPVTSALTSKASLLSDALYAGGGSLLAMAAATGLAHVMHTWRSPGTAGPGDAEQGPEEASEMLVRTALLCLAIGLAIDTWWLQKVGLGNENDAQQAGIAIAWMIYFVALRLRSSPRWRGWPWASILTVGFICTLPILMDVSWLDSTLPI